MTLDIRILTGYAEVRRVIMQGCKRMSCGVQRPPQPLHALFVGLLLILAVAFGPVSDAAASLHGVRQPRIRVLVKPAAAMASERVQVTGLVTHFRQGKRGRYLVDLQLRRLTLRKGRRRATFVTRVTAKVNKREKYVVRYRVPGRTGAIVIRLRLRRGKRAVAVSKPWRLLVRPKVPTATGTQPASSASQTLVLDPSVVDSVPDPGRAGQMEVSGTPSVTPGDIIAVGVGPATPYGFLGKVVSVTLGGSTSTLQVVPATLPEALPEGSFSGEVDPPPVDSEAVSSSVSTAKRCGDWVQVRSVVACGANGTLTATGTVNMDPRIEVSGGWGLFSGPRARFVGYMTASGSLSIAATAGASCDLEPKTLFYKPLAPITFTVGPAPVVIVPVISAKLTGGGSVEGGISTDASGSVTAHAGVDYHDGQAHPIGDISANLTGGNPPQPQGSAHVGANLSPAIDLLLYGVAGPQAAINAGLSLDTSLGQEPAWTLTAPVSLIAKMNIPALNISTSEFPIYENSFLLAEG